MDERTEERVLEELAAALERGAEPDPVELRGRFPHDGARVDRLIAAARSYARLAPARAGRPADAELAPGDRVGDFEVEGLVARGGTGEVYRAVQLSLGRRRVALKLLPPGPTTPAARTRFEREGLSLAALHHPRLAEVYGFGEERGRAFLAMRLVEGRTLRDVHEELARNGADRAEPGLRRRLVRWATEVADALAAVHARDLVHRDVKPANVVVEGSREGELEGAAVLVDFGLVRPVAGESVTMTGATPATPDYASPEQALGLEVGPASDVFSLGATLHDLLCGRLPHERGRASAGLRPLNELAPGIDRDLAAVVNKAVDPVVRWRYPSAAELHADLAGWLAGRPVAARRRPLAERARRELTERPARVLRALASAAVLGLLVLALGALGRHWNRAENARAAYAAGDVARLWYEAARVPALLRWPLLREAKQVELARRAADPTPDDPLAAIVALLQENEPEAALLRTVTRMRVDGHAVEPLYARFVEHELRRLQGPTRGVPPVLIFTARLFYERPVADPESQAAVAGIAAELWRLWQDPRVTGDARLYLLSGLAGCGTADLAVPIARWTAAAAAGNVDEPWRLGLGAVAQMSRRQYVAGLEAELDVSRIYDELLPLLGGLLLQHGPVAADWPDQRQYYPVHQLIEELTTLERVAGLDSRMAGFVPDAWLSSIESGGDAAYYVASLLAMARDPRVVGAIEDGRLRRNEFGGSDRVWGTWTALMDDHVLLARARARCAELAADDGLRAFDAGVAGVRRGDERALGPSELDEDTLLGARDPSAGFAELDLVPESSGGPGAGQALCLWDFNQMPPRRSGSAGLATARSASLERGERQEPYLRLYDFGASELRLAFQVEAQPEQQEVELRLHHMAAERGRFPYGGHAYLNVSIDGAVLVERLLVSRSTRLSVSAQRLLVPAYRLPAGRHELSLRLHPETTTTYRLFQVELGAYPGEGQRMSDE